MQKDAPGLAKENQQEVWLPEGEIRVQPFLHSRIKRQKTSLASRSSNATSVQTSQPGASVGADGSNNDASKDSNESEREPQSVGVSLLQIMIWRTIICLPACYLLSSFRRSHPF